MTEKLILELKATDIITDAVVATTGLDDNFSSHSIVEYLCSSLFLQLTGLLEQKFRAAAWTMATNNREYRREFISSSKYGEFSVYSAKNEVYKKLLSEIFTHDKNIITIMHNHLLKDAKLFILKSFEKTIFYTNYNYFYYSFNNNYELTKSGIHKIENHVKDTYQLIPHPARKELFDNLIKSRNKIAHNTHIYSSTQNNFDALYESNDTPNFFTDFFLMIYVDKVFNETYAIYDELIQAKCLSIY